MTNKFIITLFILFMLLVLYSSLQKNTSIKQIAPATPTTILQENMPTAVPTNVPTQSLPFLHPGFRVNGGGEAGDN